jgi:hypothetical protein
VPETYFPQTVVQTCEIHLSIIKILPFLRHLFVTSSLLLVNKEIFSSRQRISRTSEITADFDINPN